MKKKEHVYIAPRTPLEKLLTRIWEQVLGCERVGIKDHFQDLGGTSLHATRIFLHLRENLGINFPRRLLLEAPTIAEMAASIETSYSQGARLKAIVATIH